MESEYHYSKSSSQVTILDRLFNTKVAKVLTTTTPTQQELLDLNLVLNLVQNIFEGDLTNVPSLQICLHFLSQQDWRTETLFQ